MANQLSQLSETIRWRLLVGAAKKAVLDQGHALARVPGRGLSNIWTLNKNGQTKTAAIRTTRDRWIAFPPLVGGTKWKTLDDVDTVVVATVDSKEDPQNIEVYVFPADDVKKCFNAAYAARIKDGQTVKDNFGMWVGLDHDERGLAASVGSGIIDKYQRVATYAIADLLQETAQASVGDEEELEAASDTPALQTIAEVMAWSRSRVADIAGVKIEAVKLDLKIEY